MKKLICLIAVCLLLLSGCAMRQEPKPEPTAVPTAEPTAEPVLPPVRTGDSGMKAQIAFYDLDRAYQEADLAAHIRVGDWLGERNVEYEMELTYYSAAIVRSYKGQEEGSIVLCQDGNSKLTLGGYPLFTYGNELLLFLKHGSNSDYEDMYYVVGSYGTVMYALSDDNGDGYYMSICDGFYDSLGIDRNYADDSALRDRLAENCSDTVVKEMAMHAPFICRASDYIDKLTALSDRQG